MHNIFIFIYTIMIYRIMYSLPPDTGVYWGFRRTGIQLSEEMRQVSKEVVS